MSDLISLVRSERKKSVLRVLQNATAPMSCDEIAAIIETSPAIVSECLRKLSTDDNLVHKSGKIKRSNRSIVALWSIGGDDKKERIDKKSWQRWTKKHARLSNAAYPSWLSAARRFTTGGLRYETIFTA